MVQSRNAPGHSTLSGKVDTINFQYQASKYGINKGGGQIIQCHPLKVQEHPHQLEGGYITMTTMEYVLIIQASH